MLCKHTHILLSSVAKLVRLTSPSRQATVARFVTS